MVLEAVIDTKAYLRDLADSGKRDRKRECALAIAWQRARAAIEKYDAALFRVSGVKALGWADEAEWAKSHVDPEKLKLDTIIRQCRYLQEPG